MRKKRAGGIKFPDFRLYYKTTVWYWYKYRQIDQWNRIESPEINPCTYGQLNYHKRDKNIQYKKESRFYKRCWEKWTAICKRKELEHSLRPCKKQKTQNGLKT